MRLNLPRNPKVIPNSLAEIACEEEMNSVFMSLRLAKHTGIILDNPVPALHHIPCVEAFHKKKPSKDSDLESARAFPYPFENRINHNARESIVIIYLGLELTRLRWPSPNVLTVRIKLNRKEHGLKLIKLLESL